MFKVSEMAAIDGYIGTFGMMHMRSRAKCIGLDNVAFSYLLIFL